jgi:RNA polymerase sigma-70 factor (ECF subfamily)
VVHRHGRRHRRAVLPGAGRRGPPRRLIPWRERPARPRAPGYAAAIDPSPGSPDDERAAGARLVLAAQQGDRDALDRLLRLHHDRIAALCQRLCGNPVDAADATQEALIAIVRGLPRFDGRSQFSTWAYRVATNACLDELRRRSRRPLPGVDDRTADDGAALDARHAGPDPTESVADRLDVEGALATLPTDQRAAVVLRDLCTLDYAEIAEVLGIPAGTVRSRIARGRRALAAALEGNPGPLDRRPTPRA